MNIEHICFDMEFKRIVGVELQFVVYFGYQLSTVEIYTYIYIYRVCVCVCVCATTLKAKHFT